ncbi:hypothetical protein NP493_5g12017 [Ridgeia piscesae]|uniref:Uncharacterized protein n=1 Tax=Ridgeia piscesae TaxID=27915 RepID=A0AAD9ULJ1_RIDPI|nr:hypothetical protein NP493_5g12017 [Ridgeia piscesae]
MNTCNNIICLSVIGRNDSGYFPQIHDEYKLHKLIITIAELQHPQGQAKHPLLASITHPSAHPMNTATRVSKTQYGVSLNLPLSQHQEAEEAAERARRAAEELAEKKAEEERKQQELEERLRQQKAAELRQQEQRELEERQEAERQRVKQEKAEALRRQQEAQRRNQELEALKLPSAAHWASNGGSAVSGSPGSSAPSLAQIQQIESEQEKKDQQEVSASSHT